MNQKGFAKVILVIIVTMLIGASAYYVFVKRSAPASIVSGQNYLITTVIKISSTGSSGGGNKEQYFSVFNVNGVLLKTLNVPSDLMTGMANNVKVLGGNIYYMSGTRQITSIGAIDIQTGQSKILNFTKTNNTNPGNTLYAIIDWDVSIDNSKIAWLNTDGQISVANTDGSNVQTYNIGTFKPISNKIKFVDRYLYFDTYNSLERISLNTGSFDTVINDFWPDIYAISDSGKYIAYYTYSGGSTKQFVIKNTGSNSKYIVPEVTDVLQTTFSPNESRLTLSQFEGPGTKIQSITLDLTNSKKLYSAGDSPIVVGYISDTRIVVSTDKGLEITDLDGSNTKRLNDNEYFVGILKAK